MITENEIEIYLTEPNQEQQAEDDFFNSSDSICSNRDFYKKLFHKIRPLWMFDEIIKKHKIDLSGRVLELAGGYGAQATYLKQKLGDKIELYYSDSSLTAVRTSKEFEIFFECTIDHKWVIEAENIPTTDDYFDKIYFFAGFHHVQDTSKAIAECYRVLKKGGMIYLMLEPSCPKYLAFIYKNKVKRDKIIENFFTKKELSQLIVSKFTDHKIDYFTGFYNRESKFSLLYYLVLSCLPKILLSILPVSVVVTAKK